MIKLTVDEAYAFDYYSILELKYDNGYISKDLLDITKKDIHDQLGPDMTDNILSSDCYIKLKAANLATFEAVDKAKTDDVSASYVDMCNYQRMLAKKDLQATFFKNSLSETKVGYKNAI